MKKIAIVRKEYFDEKEYCNKIINDNGNDYERKAFKEITDNEEQYLSSNNENKVRGKIEKLSDLRFRILWRTPSFLQEVFDYMKLQAHTMNDQTQVKSLIVDGKLASDSENWDKLAEIDSRLINLLPTITEQNKFKGVGITR